MARKKRKTRQEKIILQLKRELASQSAPTLSESTIFEPRQGAIPIRPKAKAKKLPQNKKTDISVFSYNPYLIRKDLLKTLILSLAILSLQLMLYLRLG